PYPAIHMNIPSLAAILPNMARISHSIEKPVGSAEPIRQCLSPYGDAIKSAFIYGSVANGTDTAASDIDLMVIGDNLNYSDLYTAAHTAETRLGRKVNRLLLSFEDCQRKA